jgi:pilus assembly protein CpaC
VRTDTSFVDITVGDPDVADVNPLTDRTLSILGRKNGTTRVTVYAEGKKLIGVFDVEVVYDTSLIQSEMRKRFPNANLKVTAVGGRIMLSGTSPDAVTLDRALTIAKQFGPEVINTVEFLQPQQVMLEVRFVEASRQAGRELGVQWNVFGSKFRAHIGARQPANNLPLTAPATSTSIPVGEVAAGVLSGGQPFGFLLGRMLTGNTTIDVLINALEARGLVRTLAEPNLTALSGDTASFLAGGEFPIPIAQASTGTNTITVEWKRYGVGLAFTPTVLNNGQINLKIEPEVSQLDPSKAVPIGAGLPPIPALVVRRASTTVELRDGQSFVIGGLLQNESKTSLEQVPWLGSVPVLGALFASRSYQKNETDLAIIVTPRLVRPARPGDVIKTPLDGSLPANDPDLFLMGKTEVNPAKARLMAGIPPREFTGHVLDLPKGGTNVVSAKK